MHKTTHVRYAHLVGSESAGLVRANNIGTSKRLNAREIPDNRVFLSHLLGAEGETSSNDSGKTLGDGRNRQGNGNLEVINGSLEYTMMGRVRKVANVDDPDENADDRDDFCEHLTEVVEFTFEGRLLTDLGGDGLVNVANGGPLAGMNDNRSRDTIHNGRSLNES